MNDFLESFLLILGQNKYIKLRKCQQFFFSQNILKSLKSIKTYNFVYSKVYLIKATSEILLPLAKTLKYKKCIIFKQIVLDVLLFHCAFYIGCVHISNCGLSRRIHLLIIQYTLALFMKCTIMTEVN